MILTDAEKLRIAANPICCPCSPWWLKDDVVLGDVQQAAIVFANEVEREVLRKLREAGPAGYLVIWDGEQHKYAHAHASEMPADEQARRMGGTCTPLFTIPEDQT
jgi:hypothetical protein